MANIARKSDGRRIFTDKFKREQIGRVWRGELTLAELSRKLGIARSLMQRWKRLIPEAEVVDGVGRTTPVNQLRAAEYIRELQLLVGKQTVELSSCARNWMRSRWDGAPWERQSGMGTTGGRPAHRSTRG
jgi:transposase-like protein